MESINFKNELNILCNKEGVSGTDIFLFCKTNIKQVKNSDVIDFLTSSDKQNKRISRIITNLCPWTAKLFWEHLKSFTTEQERLQIFKKNYMFHEISKKNIEILHEVMHTDPSIFLFKEDNVYSVFFRLLNEKMELDFIFEHEKALNQLSSSEKKKMLSDIIEASYYTSDKQKFDIVKLLTLFEGWHKDGKAYNAILKMISTSTLKTISNKISSLLNKKIEKDILEEWNKNGKNILVDLLLTQFVVSPAFVKKCIKFQPLNIDKKASFLPLLVSKQHLLFNDNFAKSYEDIKNYVGLENLVGDNFDQDLIAKRILSDSHYYKRFFTLFKDSGKPSSLVSILLSLKNEKGLISDLKQIIDIITLSADKEFMEKADCSKLANEFENIELEFALKIVKSNIFNIFLSNMKDHEIKNILENRITIIKEKQILQGITSVQQAHNKKQRI